jgi:rubrerythrin
MSYYGEPGCCDTAMLEQSLCLISEALKDETHDRMFYQCLLQLAPDQKQQDVVKSIRDDEIKHFKMFRMIYREVMCQSPMTQQTMDFQKPASYCAGIEQAIFGELAAVELYRRIMFGLCSTRHKAMLFEIITDEMKHSIKWNFLYSKNCSSCCVK